MIAKLDKQFIDLPFLVVNPLILGFDSLVQFTLVLRVLLESVLQVCSSSVVRKILGASASLPLPLQLRGFRPWMLKKE